MGDFCYFDQLWGRRPQLAIECTASNEKFPQHVIKDLQRPQKLIKCPRVDDVASPSIKTSNYFLFCFTFFSWNIKSEDFGEDWMAIFINEKGTLAWGVGLFLLQWSYDSNDWQMILIRFSLHDINRYFSSFCIRLFQFHSLRVHTFYHLRSDLQYEPEIK